jgi:hypothetical protein
VCQNISNFFDGAWGLFRGYSNGVVNFCNRKPAFIKVGFPTGGFKTIEIFYQEIFLHQDNPDKIVSDLMVTWDPLYTFLLSHIRAWFLYLTSTLQLKPLAMLSNAWEFVEKTFPR